MKPIIQILKNEWKILIPLLILSFFLGNALVFGWQFFFWPDTRAPVLYEGDGFAFFYNFKRVAEESWFYTNQRANYPWVSNFSDFPQSDFGNYLFIKLVALITGSIVVASNLYISVGFPLAFFTMYLLLRVLNVSKVSAIVGAFSYAFLSFHFLRVAHIFFTWYFVIPCYVYLFYRLLNRTPILFTDWKKQGSSNIRHFIGLMLLPFFGGYFTLFALFGLVFCVVPLLALSKKLWQTGIAIATSGFAILLGTLLNIYPTILYTKQNGPNLEALVRIPLESELYALKFSQLFIPVGYHFNSFFRDLSNFYNSNSASINENASAVIGILPSIGVLLSLGFLIYRLVPQIVKTNHLLNDKRILIAGLFILFYVLFASIGGLVALYALLVNSTARGWNRVSIYIACFGLISFTILLDYFYQNIKSIQSKRWVPWFCSALLLAVVLIDQVPLNNVYTINTNVPRYQENESYYQKIEKSLPPNAAIFQLPFQTYPGDPVLGMGAYTHFEGHVHSQNLKWSFGGLKWREGEWFYRYLSQLPIDQQLDAAKAMGFQGVLIDKRAYCDDGHWIEQKAINYAARDFGLASSALESKLIRNDNQGRIFIPLAAVKDLQAQKNRANQHLSQIGYEIKLGNIPVPNDQWNDVIDFRRGKNPYFLKFVDGLSYISYVKKGSPGTLLDPYKENWQLNFNEELACEIEARKKRLPDNYVPVARWSDARLHKTIKLTFDRPLPKKLRIFITASAVGDNNHQPSVIKIGDVERKIQFTSQMQRYQLDLTIPESMMQMEIIPAEALDTSGKTRSIGASDRRLLALHLQSIQIIKLADKSVAN